MFHSLAARMTSIFRRNNSSKDKNESRQIDGSAFSSNGKIREVFRPPLVEGRAQIQTDVLEYIPCKRMVAKQFSENTFSKSQTLDVDDFSDSEHFTKRTANEMSTKEDIDSGTSSKDGKHSEVVGDKVSELEGSPKGEPVKDIKNDEDNSPKGSSDTSREFEPEGSIDMTPPSDSPAHSRWQEGINYLLEDETGTKLFLEYMTQQGMEKYLEFWLVTKGLKARQLEPEKIGRIARTTVKKVLNPKGKSGTPAVIECLDKDVRDTLLQRIESGQGIDVNIFDGAQNQVLEFMARTSYLKFFESDIYIDYLQNDMSEVNSSKESGTHSSASSVSGKNHSHQASSSIHSEIKKSLPAKSSQLASSGPSDSPMSSNGSTLKASHKMSHESDVAKVTTTSSNSKQSSTSVYHPISLGTVDENSEWKSDEKSTSVANLSTKSLQWHNRALGGSRGTLEPHPYSAAGSGAPFHAMSSTFNPTSRNDSDIQSLSSGAMGDTTDDNYSSFTDYSSSQFSNIKANMKAKATAEKKRQQQRLLQQQQQQIRRNRSESDGLGKPSFPPARAGHAPPPEGISPDQFAKELTEKLEAVIRERQKDAELKKKLASLELHSHSGGAGGGGTSVVSGGGTSKYYNDESDQSILDDHCDRVFNKKTPGRSPPNNRRHRSQVPNVSMNVSSMSMNASSSFGHQTWGGHRGPGRSQQQYKQQFGSYNPMNTSYPHPSMPFTQQQQPFQASTSFSAYGNRFGDLDYFPNESSNTLRQKHYEASMSSRSFGDLVEFDNGNGSTRGFNSGRSSQPPQRMPGFPAQDKVAHWIQNMQDQNCVGVNPNGGSVRGESHRSNTLRSTSVNRATMRTSPRSSGRQHSGSKHRSRSQERQQQQQQQFGSNSFFAPAPQQSRPEIPIIYTFPQSKDSKNMLPYFVKCPNAGNGQISLRKVKELCPKGGDFRYFFKTSIDGMEVNQEEYNDAAIVPLFNGKVIVECRDSEI